MKTKGRPMLGHGQLPSEEWCDLWNDQGQSDWTHSQEHWYQGPATSCFCPFISSWIKLRGGVPSEEFNSALPNYSDIMGTKEQTVIERESYHLFVFLGG